MARRKSFRKCIIKEMKDGLTRREATNKCKIKFKKEKNGKV
jgi:hypothetical protein